MSLDITGFNGNQVLPFCQQFNWAYKHCQVTLVLKEYLSHIAIAIFQRFITEIISNFHNQD